MAEKLSKCQVCGKELSALAEECNGCKSPDPFGHKRNKAQREQLLALIVVLGIAIMGALWYLGVVSPFDIMDYIISILGSSKQ